MLIMFKVKNYTSFKDEAILDMRATSYVQHPKHCIYTNNYATLLKTNAIYGANASGKSNFISAMYFFERYIFSQFITQKEADDDETPPHPAQVRLEPFLLSDKCSEASEFDIIFSINGEQFQYGFECTSNMVLNEWYYIDDKKVYERRGTQVTYGTRYKKLLSVYNKIPTERLYISVLEYFLEDIDKKEIIGGFLEFFSKQYNVHMELVVESSVKGVAGYYGVSKKLIENENFRMRVAEYLRQVDVGIKGIDVQEEVRINKKTGKETKKKTVKTVHNVYNEFGDAVDEKYFHLWQESTGTLRFFAYIQNILLMIEQGGVFIVDELSARLHPKMTKLIVDIFQSELNEKAQLIFTTHDISLLNNSQFRRDEVAFIEKNERGESRLYALSDLRVREDATFSKDYMQGRYGAIPVLNYNELLAGEKIWQG